MARYASLEFGSDEELELEEMGFRDLSEMMFEEDGSLHVARQICFLDASGWLSELSPQHGLGEYWTFDYTRAHSYSAESGHNDCVNLHATIPARFLTVDMVAQYLHVHEAEVRVDQNVELVITGITHKGHDVRPDLIGLVFHA